MVPATIACLCYLLMFVSMLLTSGPVNAERPKVLSAHTFEKEGASKGVVVLQVNWGRQWGCAGLGNAQLQKLKFSRLPLDAPAAERHEISLETPSRLFVHDEYRPYALLVVPGVYALTGFDVKVARSVSDVGHLLATESQLVQGEKPVGGTFSISSGEIVYIGHFGLDCAQEPILWRYYMEGRNEFERYVADFRKQFPFVKETPVQFRLLSDTMFGQPYSLDDSPSDAK